jgi:heme/copper-type cytochrome/quinol oxidase subunit 2
MSLINLVDFKQQNKYFHFVNFGNHWSIIVLIVIYFYFWFHHVIRNHHFVQNHKVKKRSQGGTKISITWTKITKTKGLS